MQHCDAELQRIVKLAARLVTGNAEISSAGYGLEDFSAQRQKTRLQLLATACMADTLLWLSRRPERFAHESTGEPD
ncbi:MAG: hypothetical protein IPO43_02215 [Rhodoferax sp.]|nr:hypothetical protein [Rhodoferax sp.]